MRMEATIDSLIGLCRNVVTMNRSRYAAYTGLMQVSTDIEIQEKWPTCTAVCPLQVL